MASTEKDPGAQESEDTKAAVTTDALHANLPPEPKWEDYWAHRVAQEAKNKVLGYFGIATALVSLLMTLYGVDGIQKLLERRFTKLVDREQAKAEKRIARRLK